MRGPQRDHKREEEMRVLHAQGQTLDAIGQRYRLTRERVRQILARIGITRKDGGIAIAAKVRQARRKHDSVSRRDALNLRRYGCTYKELLECNEGHPLTEKGSFAERYRQQKHNADMRGIEWHFTLPEWKRLWIESGHWHERGRGFGYVMARRGDVGPYAAWNVYITGQPQNIKDGYVFRRLRKVREQVAA